MRNATISRNDGKGKDFKRWTVYVGGKVVLDIEASAFPSGVLLHVFDGKSCGPKREALIAYDSRSDAFFSWGGRTWARQSQRQQHC